MQQQHQTPPYSKRGLVRVWIAGALAALVTIGFLARVDSKTLADVYTAKLQTPLFTGFLTLGGFLLTLKTGLLMRLKTELYETATYQQRVAVINRFNGPANQVSVYGPLQRLGSFLIVIVLLALGTSASQLTIGFLTWKPAIITCLALAAVTLTLVFAAWVEIRRNLKTWFEVLELEVRQKSAAS